MKQEAKPAPVEIKPEAKPAPVEVKPEDQQAQAQPEQVNNAQQENTQVPETHIPYSGEVAEKALSSIEVYDPRNPQSLTQSMAQQEQHN